jgi:hypothetical protein
MGTSALAVVFGLFKGIAQQRNGSWRDLRDWRNALRPSWNAAGTTLKWWGALFCLVIVTVIYQGHVADRGKIKLRDTQLDWFKHKRGPTSVDTLSIERAFIMMPRPCKVKIQPLTKQAANDRNIFSYILRTNNACEVIDDNKDAEAERFDKQDIDSPTKTDDQTFGLIIRWNEKAPKVETGIQALEGCCGMNIQVGHAMPPDIPSDVNFIQVGRDPWGTQ